MVATASLTTVKLIVGRRQTEHQYQLDWITPNIETKISGQEEKVEDDAEFGSREESLNEERDANENELSLYEKLIHTNRTRMIANLNKLGWIKINCFIDCFNAHAAIVQRSPYKQGIHTCVLEYLGMKFIK